jgi:hypothetical protein
VDGLERTGKLDMREPDYKDWGPPGGEPGVHGPAPRPRRPCRPPRRANNAHPSETGAARNGAAPDASGHGIVGTAGFGKCESNLIKAAGRRIAGPPHLWFKARPVFPEGIIGYEQG